MLPLGALWAQGVDSVIRSADVPWHVTRLGARAEYHFTPEPPRTGKEQWDNSDPELEAFLHLWAMNRRILMTPFHNMALMSPSTTDADVDRHTDVFAEAVGALFGQYAPAVELDHVLIAVTDLEAAARDFESRHGLASVDGGRHRDFGTANRIIPLGSTYLELVAVVDPGAAAASSFGWWVDRGATDEGRLIGWAVRTTALDEIAG